MFQVEKNRPEKPVSKFLPELPEIQFISLILLMCVMCFARSLQDQSLVYLQYALILLPLIHMHTQRYNGGMKIRKIKGVFLISYLLLAVSFIVSWVWSRDPISLPISIFGLLYLIKLFTIILFFFLFFYFLYTFFMFLVLCFGSFYH